MFQSQEDTMSSKKDLGIIVLSPVRINKNVGSQTLDDTDLKGQEATMSSNKYSSFTGSPLRVSENVGGQTSDDKDLKGQEANMSSKKDSCITGSPVKVTENVSGQTSDDTDIIAYEKAVIECQDKILQNSAGLRLMENCDSPKRKKYLKKTRKNSNKTNNGNDNRKWMQGQNCRAVCHVDDIEYEAVICTLNYEKDQCIVKFLGYGNSENVPISSLKPSYGRHAILNQQLQAESTDTDRNESLYSSPKSTSGSLKYVPPAQSESTAIASEGPCSVSGESVMSLPTPPFIPGQELLSSALLGWYLAGYHTGIYEASQRKKKTKLSKA